MNINVKFDHNQEEFISCLGLSKYDEHYVKAAIVFETIASATKVVELYDKIEDAPVELRTVSGSIQRSLQHCNTDAQRLYLLLNFHKGYNATKDALEKAAKAAKIEGKVSGDDLSGLLGVILDAIQSEGIRHTIAQVKRCNYDFQVFVEKTLPEKDFGKQSEKFKDIDDMLNGILGKNE